MGELGGCRKGGREGIRRRKTKEQLGFDVVSGKKEGKKGELDGSIRLCNG